LVGGVAPLYFVGEQPSTMYIRVGMHVCMYARMWVCFNLSSSSLLASSASSSRAWPWLGLAWLGPLLSSSSPLQGHLGLLYSTVTSVSTYISWPKPRAISLCTVTSRGVSCARSHIMPGVSQRYVWSSAFKEQWGRPGQQVMKKYIKSLLDGYSGILGCDRFCGDHRTWQLHELYVCEFVEWRAELMVGSIKVHVRLP
jgi:hypothetical protein